MMVSCFFYAQVTIGKTTPSTSPANSSVSLEFGNATGGNKGIVVPWVTQRTAVTGVVPGTIVFDTGDTEQKVYYATSVSSWVDLSDGARTPATLNKPDTNTENPDAKALIGGSTTDATPGVLVLAATDKAMVLPRVSSVSDIASPSAGMMVFLTGTTANPINLLAVYNGSEWTFWGADVPMILSPATNKIWMDRNLGATQVATASNDAAAYGHLYQWGRLADGHQIRTSTTTTVVSTTDVPGNSNFITNGTAPGDWRNPQNNNLWQGANGVNNPCPLGFRLPTIGEFQAEGFANAAAAFASPLKLTAGGNRTGATGALADVGTTGYYATSTVSGTSVSLYVLSPTPSTQTRATGASVRCIKN